jgi:23S rRNA (uridine2552-2'-O)-methyltransferase
MAKKRRTSAWAQDHIRDPYVKLALRDGYRTRAAYKLKEIDEQDRLIRPGQTIVDLGAAPGGWSQYIRSTLKSKASGAKSAGRKTGRVIALDRDPMVPIPDVTFIQGDFHDAPILEQLKKILGTHKADLVLSDMAPNLSGVSAADSARIEELCLSVLEFACCHLQPKGALLVKCFYGSGYSQIVERFKQCFKSVAARKPKASRSTSAETFILGKVLK